MSISAKNLRILIVDDVSTPRRVLKQLLKSLGVENVDEASDGKEALEKICKNPYNVILCDFYLGDTTGLEILRKVRTSDSLKDTPFIMITSDLKKNDLVEAKEAGVSGYMLKPFDMDSLYDNLCSAFRLHNIEVRSFSR